MKIKIQSYTLLMSLALALPLVAVGQAPTRPDARQLAAKFEEIKAMPAGRQRLVEILRLTRNPAAINPESEQWIARSIREADSLSERGLQAELMANYAYVLISKKDLASAEDLLDRANAIIQKLDNIAQLGPLNSLAIGYQRLNAFDKTLAAYQQVAAFTRGKDGTDMRMHYMTVLQNKATLYHRSGQYEQQLAAVEEAQSLLGTIDLPSALFNIKFNIASSLVQLNKPEEAAAIFNALMPDIERNAGGRTPLFYSILGEHHMRLGHESAAAEFFNRIFHWPTASPQEKLRAAVQLVKLHIGLGNADSVTFYEQQAAQWRKNPMARYDEQDVQLMEGMVQAFRGNHDLAKQHYRTLTASPSPAGSVAAWAKLHGHLQLAALYLQEGSTEEARHTLSEVDSEINSPYVPHTLKTTYYRLMREGTAVADGSSSVADTAMHLAAAQHAETDSLLRASSLQAYADMEARYRLQEKDHALQVSQHQATLHALELDKQRQRNLILSLASVVAIMALGGTIGALAYRRRQQSDQHRAEKATLAQQHRIETAKALKDAQEQERKGIAHKLHDEVGAMLSIAKLNVSQLDESVFVAGSDAEKKLKTTEKLLDEVSDTVRQLSHTLMPVVLEKYGLKRGIEDLLQSVATAKKIKVEQVIEGLDDTSGWDPDFCLSIYRIVQEIVNNILKHAQATHALLQIVELPDAVTLYVEDNGKGLAVPSQSNGVGLKLLQSNIAYLDGTIEIDGKENKGTFILIELPIAVPNP